MTSRILEQEACIRQALTTDHKNAHLIPMWQDLDVLESMQGALGPLGSVDIDELMNACTYLDSRFKLTSIEDDVSAALVNDHLAQEGVEVIEE